MTPLIIFALCAVLIVGIGVVLWRYWENLTQVSPEEEMFDRRVARLNERQAYQMTDDELARPITEDEAWKVMVARGRRASQRHDRYNGDLERRVRARRRL